MPSDNWFPLSLVIIAKNFDDNGNDICNLICSILRPFLIFEVSGLNLSSVSLFEFYKNIERSIYFSYNCRLIKEKTQCFYAKYVKHSINCIITIKKKGLKCAKYHWNFRYLVRNIDFYYYKIALFILIRVKKNLQDSISIQFLISRVYNFNFTCKGRLKNVQIFSLHLQKQKKGKKKTLNFIPLSWHSHRWFYSTT